MGRFKKGDKVECIEGDALCDLIEGRVYTVSETDYDEVYIEALNEWFDQNLFKGWEPPPPEPRTLGEIMMDEKWGRAVYKTPTKRRPG